MRSLCRKGCITAMRTDNKGKALATDTAENAELSKIVSAMVEQRHHLGISQRDLAEMCGVPHSTVARIEAGRIVPNMGTLLKICERLYLTIKIEPIQTEE